MRAQRIAMTVADTLRRRILDPATRDGDVLAKEDDLREEFQVGKPAIREALRILESEGLVEIRRGNRGGAVVHKPRTEATAYSIGLALAARRVDAVDVGAALREIEPACVAACARRADRADTVVPALTAITDEARRCVDDAAAVAALARRFHETLVAHCGNETLVLVVGALEGLWSSHVASVTAAAADRGRASSPARRSQSIAEHEALVALIAAGDADAARQAALAHLERVQRTGLTAEVTVPIDLATLRTRLRP